MPETADTGTRLDSAEDRAEAAWAAPSNAGGGGRERVFRPGMAFGPPAAEYHRGDPLAWGGGALGSGSLPSTRHPRPSAPKRKAAAQPAAGLREQGYALATRARAGRVGGREACHRDWPPHSRLVSHRSAPRADPPGADPRSARALRSTSPAGYGSDPEPAYPRELVPTALARGGDLSGSTKNARGETQRPGTPPAMARTTPSLFALF